ncbi:MAG TPA: P-loop NTPase fold protein [Pyrinomonadaceae bacterium]|jgi:hypothetical protein
MPSAQIDENNPSPTTDPTVAVYTPTESPVPEQILPKHECIVVLDQGQEGAAVGNGMATTINYLLRERGIYEQVSARMLQQLSKQYSDLPLGEDKGSFLRDGMRAWLENGVCPEALWPYKPLDYGALTPERAAAAVKYKPLGYQRIPNGVEVMRAAIYEHHAAVISILVHSGWMVSKPSPVIAFNPKNDSTVGGHCVSVLGYTREGFIIQNSWGPYWGRLRIGQQVFPGAALLTYSDFEAHYDGEGYIAILPETLAAVPLLRRAGYRSDTLESEDRLDIMPDVEAVCSVLAARDVKPPLALGLFGNWGTGKSFFMARMSEEIDSLAALERENPGLTPYCSNILQIRFNAWHYLDANLWASLVSELFNRMLSAFADSKETPEQTRKRVVRELGKARGLFRQSRMELEQAKRERDQAQITLDQRAAEVRSREISLGELKNDLVTLLANDPSVKEDLDKVANQLGAPKVGESYQALKTQVEEIQTSVGKARKLLQMIFKPEGRRDRLILLLGALAVPVLIGFAVYYLAQQTGLLHEFSRPAGLGSGLATSVLVLLGQALKGTKVLDALQTAVDRVEHVRQQRLNVLVQPEEEELKKSTQAEQEAKIKLEGAKSHVDSLEQDLEALSPTYQMESFVKERINSEDYKKQLGLISLIRRDFERLSDLLQTSDALEARWYEGLRAAQEAKKKFKPKRRLLPFQRIVLYVDDLDRCQPDRVIEVLEAVHLLLAFPLFVVVVAVDPRWLRQCLETHYPDLLATENHDADDDESLRQPSTPQDYLEKIFQIPFYLRPITDSGYRGLIDGLVGTDVAAAAKEAGFTHTPQIKSDKGADGQSSTSGPARAGIVIPQRHKSETVAADPKKRRPADKLNPEQLKFQEWELEDIKRLSPLFRTPRAVKRFLNTYRLVRVGIPSHEMAAFEGTVSHPGLYRIAQVLLAVVAGYPNLAPRFLQRLREQSNSVKGKLGTWPKFLDRCATLAKEHEPSEPARQAKPAKAETKKQPAAKKVSAVAAHDAKQPDAYYWQEWKQLCETLREISTDDYLPENLEDYHDLIPRIARFSFSVSMLSE